MQCPTSSEWESGLRDYMLIASCQSVCSCSCQCSTTIVKRMKQAILFVFLVLKYFVYLVWVIDLHLIIHCLQEWFVQVNQRVLKELVLWTLHTQGGWLATQSTPLDQPLTVQGGNLVQGWSINSVCARIFYCATDLVSIAIIATGYPVTIATAFQDFSLVAFAENVSFKSSGFLMMMTSSR